MKVVLDTSVLIAAFYTPPDRPSFSREVFEHLSHAASIHASPFIFKEFREKCMKKLRMTKTEAEGLESLLLRIVQLEPEPPLAKVPSLRDPDDLPIASLALAVRADLLITWDKDLLVLNKVGTTPVVTPRQFWDSL